MKNNKIILVTGASAGMGNTFAETLLQEGHTVYAVARRLEKMTALQEKGAHTLKMDITVEADVKNVVDTIIKNHGQIDVLVNNAGFATYGAVEDTSIEDARYQFEVNLFGLARLTQLVLPHMREKRSGTIINISSMGGVIHTPLGAWYHATKHALEGWSDCLRLEVAQFGIDVVIVQPGAIQTEFGEVMNAPMLKRSGDGPYGKMAHAIAKSVEDSYQAGQSSPPSVIARLITKAIRADRPKTRYAAGKYAKLLMGLNKWLPDRWFDRAVMQMVK